MNIAAQGSYHKVEQATRRAVLSPVLFKVSQVLHDKSESTQGRGEDR
jgi:hypothetical protein